MSVPSPGERLWQTTERETLFVGAGTEAGIAKKVQLKSD